MIDVEESKALKKIEDQMRRMIEGEAKPYDAGLVIWGTAMSVPTSPDLLHPLWLIWGALTDWAERQPEETIEAEAKMMRAAKEWLSLGSTGLHSRKTYLDRWVYDEMGYQRKNPDPPVAPDAAHGQ
jgi:hypothetical protein